MTLDPTDTGRAAAAKTPEERKAARAARKEGRAAAPANPERAARQAERRAAVTPEQRAERQAARKAKAAATQGAAASPERTAARAERQAKRAARTGGTPGAAANPDRAAARAERQAKRQAKGAGAPAAGDRAARRAERAARRPAAAKPAGDNDDKPGRSPRAARAPRAPRADATEGGPSRAALQRAAQEAQKAGDYTAALTHWNEFRQRFPTVKSGVIGAIRTAKAAGEIETLTNLVQEGAAAFPSSAAKLRKLAEAPAPEATADDGWAALQSQPPTDARAELKAAMAPFNLKQREGRKQRYKESRERVETVLKRFPDFAPATDAHLTILRRLGKTDAAARAATDYASQFPKSQKLALTQIAVLDDAKDYEGALRAAQHLKKTAKPSVRVDVAYIRALSRAGRLDQADAECAKAVAAQPDNVSLICEHASLATRRGDWTEALARWTAAEKLQPGNNKIKHGLDAVKLQLADLQPPGTETQDGETGRFFAQFESIGGTGGGCEFGMVQRKYGATSLGLLRWSNIKLESLIKGLNANFDGLGLLENTQLKTLRVNAEREEWIIRDVNYGLGGHTFISVKDVPEDKMLVQTAKRLTFLRGRLLEEIRNARKIFVYKFAEPVDDAAIEMLFEALRRQGPATLLCVLKANDDQPKGTVRKLADGLYVGHLGHYMADLAGEERGIDYAAWKSICATTLAMIERQPASQPASPDASGHAIGLPAPDHISPPHDQTGHDAGDARQHHLYDPHGHDPAAHHNNGSGDTHGHGPAGHENASQDHGPSDPHNPTMDTTHG